jgi:hypothetical protein
MLAKKAGQGRNLPPLFMISRLALILVCSLGFAHASQPTSLADLPDANPDAELKAFVVPEGLEVNLLRRSR